MRAAKQSRYGIPVVIVDDAPMPVPNALEVLVRVRATGLNVADWVAARGEPYLARLMFGLRRPRLPIQGRDLAGTVAALGSQVRGFDIGDEVYVENNSGAFAEYACVPAAYLARKPVNLSFEQAAVVPLSGNTALQGLRELADVRPGQRVLINGASGGVGTFAVQIAKALGAEVTGVCSTHNLELVRGIGADHVVDYTTTDFTTTGERYDVIFDSVGNHSLRANRRALTRHGMLVLSSGAGDRVFGPLGRLLPAMLWSPFISQRLRAHAATRSAARLDHLRELIERGAVIPVIERVERLSDLPQAFAHLGTGRTRGKVAVTVCEK